VIAPSGEQIEIVHGDQRVIVVEVGGGLREYTLDGRNVLDGYGADEMSGSGRGQVLIPWPNRIQDGRYSFDGHDYQLPLDDVGSRTRSTASSDGSRGSPPTARTTGWLWSTCCIRGRVTRSRWRSASFCSRWYCAMTNPSGSSARHFSMALP